MKTILTLAAGLMMLAAPAFAQTPNLELTAGVERLHYRYRFDNDSSFDTSFLVPHFFEQRYELTAPVIGVSGRWRLFTRAMRTEISFARDASAFGSDFDTFFQPSGDVVTSGTAGGVRLAGVRIGQRAALFARDAIVLSAAFAWQRDRADFLPADRVVTRTQPPSETREWITDRERTVSQTFEVGIEAEWRRRAADSPWRLEANGRVMPALRARLLVQLPDKYPGRDIIFSAAGWSAGGRVAVSRRFGAVDTGLQLSVERAGSYRRTARFKRDGATLGMLVAFGSRR